MILCGYLRFPGAYTDEFNLALFMAYYSLNLQQHSAGTLDNWCAVHISLMIITIAETETTGLLLGLCLLTCMFRLCERCIRGRARCLSTLPRGTLAAYNTTMTFFATFTVTYFVVRNIHLFKPDDIYSTRHLRISKMFYAIRRRTNLLHPAYTDSISRAKQRSLGAQMRPPHSVTTPSLPIRY